MDRCVVIYLLLIITYTGCCVCERNETTREMWWIETGRVLGIALTECWTNAKTPVDDNEQSFSRISVMLNCLQDKFHMILTKISRLDVIPLVDGIELIRYQTPNNHTDDKERMSRMKDVKQDYDTSSLSSWRSVLIDTISDVFETHAIRITMRDLLIDSNESEARGRKKGGMLPLMMFGVVALGTILVPMGFQFLAVVGGKALLLAKMALILSSIQGLKKIAASNLNYGYDRKAEDLGHSYRADELYYGQSPNRVLEYKHT